MRSESFAVMLSELRVHPPYVYTAAERGADDAYYGRHQRESGADYLRGYAFGLGMRRRRDQIRMARARLDAGKAFASPRYGGREVEA